MEDIPRIHAHDWRGRVLAARHRCFKLRSQVREKRVELRAKEAAKSTRTDAVFAFIRRTQHDPRDLALGSESSIYGNRPIKDLIQDLQNAADEYEIVADAYDKLRNALDDEESVLEEMEEQIHPNLAPQELSLEAIYHCDSCRGTITGAYFYCSSCDISTCFSCAENGLSCASQDHILLKRVFDTKTRAFVDEQLYTAARGLRVLVRGQLISGIGDTGSDETIISEQRCREMGEEVVSDPNRITLANGREMLSMGTVNIPVAFADSPDQLTMVIARVVKGFSFDILLGNPFLQATHTMQKYIHRFTRCLFPTKNLWSFYRIGETAQRFHATMGNNISFAGLADTGSRRNVMSSKWAFKHGFEIRSETHNIGWITFPVGPEEPTIGQVHTSISLPNEKLVPIVFDVLPTCQLPVVLGVDFVLDNDIYQKYASSFYYLQRNGDGAEPSCMGMGRIPWFAKIGGSIKNVVDAISKKITCRSNSCLCWESTLIFLAVNTSTSLVESQNFTDNINLGREESSRSDTAELRRQLAWDRTYDGGKTASVEERNTEIQRRRAHEGILYPDNQSNPVISLNPHRYPDPSSISESSTRISTAESNQFRDTETGGLAAVRDPPQRCSADGGSLIRSSDLLERTERIFLCTTPFGQLEAAQWQTE